VVGTDVVVVVEAAQQGTDAEMEHANAIPTVKTNIVVMMVVEEVVELAKEEHFVKVRQTRISTMLLQLSH